MPDLTLETELQWVHPEVHGGAEDATWGELRVWAGSDVLWGALPDSRSRGIRWTWVDLLEHLAEVWPWLLYEEGWPPGPRIDRPSSFLLQTRAWLDELPPSRAQEQEQELYEFRHRHDLALGIQGKVLPSLWIVREGKRAWVGGPGCSVQLAFDHVRDVLRSLGDQIAGRLGGLDDERAREAIASWEARLELPCSALAAISVGLPESGLRVLAQDDLAEVFELKTDPMTEEFAPNELLAVARMTVPITDPSVVRTILDQLRDLPHRSTPDLDQLSRRARTELEAHDVELKPAVLGYHLAGWLREQLGLRDDRRVDPESLLQGWNVWIGELGVDDDALEAIASWGPRHGPAILVNNSGRHSQSIAGRRATLAHEICHLLVDRDGALPLVEVLGGHVSAALEQRARAFAAELLIPRELAGARFVDDTNPSRALEDLCRTMGVSKEIVAWQAYNSRHALSWSAFSTLRQQVSRRKSFVWRAEGA